MFSFLTSIPLQTATFYPASPEDQILQHQFQPAVTGHQRIAENSTDNTPPPSQKMVATFTKIIPLLRNLHLKDETLIDMKNFYDDMNLNLMNSINKYRLFLQKFGGINMAKFWRNRAVFIDGVN